MKKTKIIPVLLWAGILLMLVLPGIQQYFSIFPEKPLNGAFTLEEYPEFSKSAWLDNSWQKKMSRYLNEHLGFRPLLIRSKNQLDFTLFHKLNTEGIVDGKEDWLYEYDYIREYIGEDFTGKKIIDRRIRQFKFLQEYLKKEKNIDLVLVLEPGKATVYPEYIPDRYLPDSKRITNTDVYLEKIKDYRLRYIDLDACFRQWKDTVAYPLYPQYGIHWSEYGAFLAADSLLRYIEKLRNIKLSSLQLDSVVSTKIPRFTDYDVGKTLNLLFELPLKQNLAYPQFHFSPAGNDNKPMVLTIADSYYWNIFNMRIPKHIFGNEAFWYFNKKVYPETYLRPLFVEDLNLKEEIEKQNIIFLMVTKRFLYKFDWGWTQKAFRLFGEYPSYQSKLNNYLEQIFSYEPWFKKLIVKSHRKNRSLESVLPDEAGYLYANEHKAEYIVYKGIDNILDKIKSDENWLEDVRQKAKRNSISLDSMLIADAEYVLRTKHPAIAGKAIRFYQVKQKIMRNDSLRQKVENLQQRYYLNREEAIQLLAEKMTGFPE